MIPSVAIQKVDGQTGSVAPSALGVCALVAAAASGTQNQASSYARQDLASAQFGVGPLAEFGAYVLAAGGNPFVAVRPTTAVAATIFGLNIAGVLGTSVVTTSGTPVDEYQNLGFTIQNPGTIGLAGITYTTTADGETNSAVQALGTATSLTVPGTGVTFDLAAGTLLAGDTAFCFTTAAMSNDADLPAALEALRVTRLPWEGGFISCVVDSGTITLLDTWLQGQEAVGQFHFFVVNTRHKNQPVPATESEATFLTAMTTLTAAMASERLCVGTDAGDMTSLITGYVQPRPVGLALIGRAMGIPIGTDASYVATGPDDDFTISDTNGNPRWHDEALYPGLDALRLVTFRSFNPGGPQGAYITNPNVISAEGSDYVYLQHIRTMNAACTVAYQVLTKQLSLGVGKKAPDPVTGQVYIAEQDAQRIEGLVNEAFSNPANGLVGQTASLQFSLSRTDNLTGNQGATVTGQIKNVALAYIKKFKVNDVFANA